MGGLEKEVYFGEYCKKCKHEMLKEDEELGINNGDIVIGPSELWVLQGGFKDRFNQYYANGLSDGLGCINVLFI